MHRGAVECFNIAFGKVRSTAALVEMLALVEVPAVVGATAA